MNLIKGYKVRIQVKAAAALDAVASNNQHSQKEFLDLDTPKSLLRLYSKVKYSVIFQMLDADLFVNPNFYYLCRWI